MSNHKTITAAKFKAQCLKIMDEVNTQKYDLVITKRGKPVAMLVPMEDVRNEEVFGCMKGAANFADKAQTYLSGSAVSPSQLVKPHAEHESLSQDQSPMWDEDRINIFSQTEE